MQLLWLQNFDSGEIATLEEFHEAFVASLEKSLKQGNRRWLFVFLYCLSIC